jgi:Beta-ketoacyl synthase, N-terminal domain
VVHNAASGYWTMGTGCTQASTALTAFEHSFAAGLLEAATQCTADEREVLLVGCVIEARGALKSVPWPGMLATALVLAPRCSARSLAALAWSLQPGPASACVPRSEAAQSLAHNAMVDAVPLFEALAL